MGATEKEGNSKVLLRKMKGKKYIYVCLYIGVYFA